MAYRQNIGTEKDITNKHFNDFRLRMLDMLADYPSLIVASGHEQNNTVLKTGRNFFINSGAPQQGSFAHIQNKHASTRQPWVHRSNLYRKRQYRTGLSRPDINAEATKQILINAPCGDTNLPNKNEVYQPCKKTITASEKMSGTYPASVELAAGPEYKAGSFKRNCWAATTGAHGQYR